MFDLILNKNMNYNLVYSSFVLGLWQYSFENHFDLYNFMRNNFVLVTPSSVLLLSIVTTWVERDNVEQG